MRLSTFLTCLDFACTDTRRSSYRVPDVDFDPAGVTVVLISEASPENPADHYYAGEDALFAMKNDQNIAVRCRKFQKLIKAEK